MDKETREGCRAIYRLLRWPMGVAVTAAAFLGGAVSLLVGWREAAAEALSPAREIAELIKGSTPDVLFLGVSLALLVVGVLLLAAGRAVGPGTPTAPTPRPTTPRPIVPRPVPTHPNKEWLYSLADGRLHEVWKLDVEKELESGRWHTEPPLTVIMLLAQTGSPDGIKTRHYRESTEHTFRTKSELDLGWVFLRQGWAAPAQQTAAESP